MPATINNDLPGTEISIGADTALNTIVEDVDKIKESAVASQRCYVVEVMGHDCGYLALMSGLASGAERVYLPEDGITLDDLRHDVREMVDGFRHGKRLGLIVRSEHADPYYTTQFLVSLYEKEGGDLFDARPSILGHTQQGGRPSPFDRIQASRLAAVALERLVDPRARAASTSRPPSAARTASSSSTTCATCRPWWSRTCIAPRCSAGWRCAGWSARWPNTSRRSTPRSRDSAMHNAGRTQAKQRRP